MIASMITQTLKPKKKPPIKRVADERKNATRISDIVINGEVHIPAWVSDHDAFRRWAVSDDFPRRGQFFFLGGSFWVDLSMETLIHNQIKAIFSIVVGSIVLNEVLGRYIRDRMMLAHIAAGLSCEPDGMFISNDAIDNGRASLKDGDESLEIIGTPDMVLEVISKSSISKDTVNLKQLYAAAGITEYWLVDSTIETPELVIMRLVTGRYVPVRKHDGWVRSKVFGRSFRLMCCKDAKSVSHFNLETK